MFGHIQANFKDLSDEERIRYKSCYCGLCLALKKQYGFFARFALTYDLTFLAMLLSSLYEPDETIGKCRCCVHPCGKHQYSINKYTEYAADMTIALTYYKCIDDWNDDKNLIRKCYAGILKKHYDSVKVKWKEQCRIIEVCMNKLTEIEKNKLSEPDAAANCFGRLMEELFIYKKDNWEFCLRKLGNSLGRYIYFADAAIDLKKDKKKGSYNPLNFVPEIADDMKPVLKNILGEASECFEYLPLVQDVHILRNILYSGIWILYNQGMAKEKKVKK